jgi:alpha-tubulin suppressor-like RCC1 family protein
MSRYLISVLYKSNAVRSFIDIKTFQDHALALRNDNTIWAWGDNQYGQLGDNTTTSRLTPVQIAGTSRSYTKISAGSRHSLSLDSSGSIWSWGNNAFGQLGDNTTTSRLTPVSVIGETLYTKISAGKTHNLAIALDNALLTWGSNTYGELGDNTNTNKSSPNVVGIDYVEIAAGHNYSLGVSNKTNAWGFNDKGQLGDNSTTSQLTPVNIAGNLIFYKISANLDFSLAIDDSRYGWAWGNNDNGQLGDNNTTSQLTPVQIYESTITLTEISNGNAHSLAIDNTGVIWSWGKNNVGQLGDGSTADRSVPNSIYIPNVTFTKVSAGNEFSLALDNTGKIWAWGSNSFGKLGINAAVTESRLTPTQL